MRGVAILPLHLLRRRDSIRLSTRSQLLKTGRVTSSGTVTPSCERQRSCGAGASGLNEIFNRRFSEVMKISFFRIWAFRLMDFPSSNPSSVVQLLV